MCSPYLKGHVGAWAPRQPQWQHWGALWLTALVHSGVAAATRWDAGRDAGAVRLEAPTGAAAEACMAAEGWIGLVGGGVCVRWRAVVQRVAEDGEDERKRGRL